MSWQGDPGSHPQTNVPDYQKMLQTTQYTGTHGTGWRQPQHLDSGQTLMPSPTVRLPPSSPHKVPSSAYHPSKYGLVADSMHYQESQFSEHPGHAGERAVQYSSRGGDTVYRVQESYIPDAPPHGDHYDSQYEMKTPPSRSDHDLQGGYKTPPQKTASISEFHELPKMGGSSSNRGDMRHWQTQQREQQYYEQQPSYSKASVSGRPEGMLQQMTVRDEDDTQWDPVRRAADSIIREKNMIIHKDDESTSKRDRKRKEVKFVPNMKCPVCRKDSRFDDRHDFMRHWVTYHEKSISLFYCPARSCDKFFYAYPDLAFHYSVYHSKRDGDTTKACRKARRVNIPSKDYIDPGNLTLRISQKVDRSTRFLEAKRHKQLIEKGDAGDEDKAECEKDDVTDPNVDDIGAYPGHLTLSQRFSLNNSHHNDTDKQSDRSGFESRDYFHRPIGKPVDLHLPNDLQIEIDEQFETMSPRDRDYDHVQSILKQMSFPQENKSFDTVSKRSSTYNADQGKKLPRQDDLISDQHRYHEMTSEDFSQRNSDASNFKRQKPSRFEPGPSGDRGPCSVDETSLQTGLDTLSKDLSRDDLERVVCQLQRSVKYWKDIAEDRPRRLVSWPSADDIPEPGPLLDTFIREGRQAISVLHMAQDRRLLDVMNQGQGREAISVLNMAQDRRLLDELNQGQQVVDVEPDPIYGCC